MTPTLRLSATALLLGLCGLAGAADAPAAQGVVNLSASASVEVPRDLLSVTLTATRDGADAAAVQSALKQALDAALVEAKKAARPGQVEVQTGNFSLFPHYGKQGVISGWQGSAELVVEGRDMQAIAALAGRITSMTIARVGYNLSRELRERLEGELAAQAIGRFRAKAADYAKQFGYTGYAVREVSVASGEPSFPSPMPRVRATAASSDEALPVEPGKGMVTVTVSGSVQMK
jgi:predicted secreted protein